MRNLVSNHENVCGVLFHIRTFNYVALSTKVKSALMVLQIYNVYDFPQMLMDKFIVIGNIYEY